MARRSLAEARVVITGASSGIGRELARQLAEQRARLWLTARRADRLEQLKGEIQGLAPEIQLLAGDITSAELRGELVERVGASWGGLDVLVNNAGVGGIGKFAEATEDRLRRIMEVNFFAPVELIRAALPLLLKGRRPLITNIGSVLGHRAVPFKSEYCASKFALHGFSDALRAELSEVAVDLLLVSPSTTASEFFDRVLDTETDDRGLRGRGMSPAAVARQTIRAMRRGRHEVVLSGGGKLLVWLDRLCPTLTNRILARAARRR